MDTGTMFMLVLLAAVVLIVVLTVRFKIHAFVALIIACIFVGIGTGMPLPQIAHSIENGMGGTLGFIATIMGLGTILGKMMEVSGGAERMARTMLTTMGEKRAAWVMTIVGLIAGIPVFFEVGFVLLFPLVFIVARQAKLPLLYVGIPLAVSLMIVHCMVPPHPAAAAITTALGADIGKVIIYALLVGTPAAIIAGPLWSKYISTKCSANIAEAKEPTPDEKLPGFGITLFTILLPLFIMVAKTIGVLYLTKDAAILPVVTFIGNPITALLISVFVAYYTLGLARGLTMKDLQTLTEQCFAPIAGIMLIIGGGGAFNAILSDSGLGKEFAKILMSLNMNPIILAWLVASLMHLAIGSATVAMITSAGIVAPLLAVYPGLSPEIVVLAIGAGAIGWCHVNDSSFWFIKEFLGLSLPDMLKSFTVACLIASVVALGGILVLAKIGG